MNPQRITQLKVENVKKIKALTIDPTGNIVTIGGKNGAGKTSTLDSISMLLGGKDAFPSRPVREGAESAHIVAKLTDYVVERTIGSDGSTALSVRSHEGAKFSSPQAMLDKIVGDLTFDPLAFTRMRPVDQVAVLRSLVKLDFREVDAHRKGLYDERTAVNRGVKDLAAQIDGMPFDASAPTEELSITNLLKQLEEAQAQNRGNAEARRRVDIRQGNLNEKRARLGDVNREIERIEEQLAALKKTAHRLVGEIDQDTLDLSNAAADADALQDVDTSAITESIASAEETNSKVRMNRARLEAEKRVSALEETARSLTARIDQIDQDKRAALEAAKFPVPGLGFDDTGVLFNGLPFDQASSAEQLRVSVAMGMALNPILRSMCIRDGSLLDEDSLRLIADMAESHNYQIFIETVDTDGPTTIVIEDGAIKGAEVAEPAAV